MGGEISKSQIHFDSITNSYPVFICFLGNFRLLKTGESLTITHGGKMETLLASLVFHQSVRVPREVLLDTLWPDVKDEKAMQSLNSLIHYMNKLLSEALRGAVPILHEAGYYWLNDQAGIGIDIKLFDELVSEGEEKIRQGNLDSGMHAYRRAASLYRGDIQSGSNIQMVLERERLRVRYMKILEQLANYSYMQADYELSIEFARNILSRDPCCEEAHRLMMRCYIGLGERAQALRQYQLCQEILRSEFDAAPELATTDLYNQLRLNPDSL